MAIRPGKPGTRRVIGLQRAQLAKIRALCNAIFNYNAKLAARTPPVVFLTQQQATNFSTTSSDCVNLLNQKN